VGAAPSAVRLDRPPQGAESLRTAKGLNLVRVPRGECLPEGRATGVVGKKRE
jgi:hypothetical protein